MSLETVTLEVDKELYEEAKKIIEKQIHYIANACIYIIIIVKYNIYYR